MAVVDAVHACGVGQCPDHRLDAVAVAQPGLQPLLQGGEGTAAFRGGRVAVEVVDDVVGPAGEAVQGVHGGAPRDGEQPGGEEVGLAVPGVEATALRVGGAQCRDR